MNLSILFVKFYIFGRNSFYNFSKLSISVNTSILFVNILTFYFVSNISFILFIYEVYVY